MARLDKASWQATERHKQCAHVSRQAFPRQAGEHRERVRALPDIPADTQLSAQGRPAARAQRRHQVGRLRGPGQPWRLRSRRAQGQLSCGHQISCAQAPRSGEANYGATCAAKVNNI